MTSPNWPVLTIGPKKMVGIWLLWVPSSSSQVDDQQAVVRLRKLNIGIYVGLQPGVGLLNGAIVHVVVQVGNYDRDGGQGSEVGGKACEWQVARRGHVGEIHPGIVLARVRPGGANRGPGSRQIFREAQEGFARSDGFCAKIGGRKWT
jgi:hypothetical protein